MGGIDRRRWLGALLPKAAELVARSVERRLEDTMPRQRRPPGAGPEPLFLATCTRCDKCAEACQYNAIFVFSDDAGPTLRGTPVLVPDERACQMCEGFPCAAACPEKALIVPMTKTWRLGLVELRRDVCITFAGPECGACVGLCPASIDAIKLVRWRPEVDTSQCIGCGICIRACPTSPPALQLVPLEG
jgi:ferredoxin-type protein NapG/ferredoxin-type protein NapH